MAKTLGPVALKLGDEVLVKVRTDTTVEDLLEQLDKACKGGRIQDADGFDVTAHNVQNLPEGEYAIKQPTTDSMSISVLRQVFAEKLGERDTNQFSDGHLQNLLDKECSDEGALQDATREGLQTPPALPPALIDKILKAFGQPGLSAEGSKFDHILSVLKANANPKASAISNVGSAEADAILLELGFLQEDGNKAYPIVVPAEAPNCSSFDYSQFSSQDIGTPWLLKHHEKQLTQFRVRFGRSFFEIHDVHCRQDLRLLLPSGASYNGGLDGIVAPWGLTKAGAVTEMHVAYEHKQSAAQKRLYREAHLEGFELDLRLHPLYSAFSGKNLFHHSSSAWKGYATIIQNMWFCVAYWAAQVWLHMGNLGFRHERNLLLPPAFASSTPFATQGRESGSGGEHTTFTGKRKGQSVVALLAACALNSYPLLLDLTDDATHHVLQLTGTSLICWTDLMPQQAYYKQAEWLARPDSSAQT